MILIGLALLAVLAVAFYGWMLRADYVASKLSAVLNPPRLSVGPTSDAASEAQGKPRVLIIGDSRVGRWRPPPVRVEAEFFLRGAGGETSAGGLQRIEAELKMFRPDIVVVMTGINDLVAASLNPDMAQSIERDLVSNIIGLAEAAKQSGATPVIATIVPPATPDWVRRTFIWSDTIWVATGNANTEIARRAAERNFRIFDVAAAVGAAAEPLAPTLSEDTLHWNRQMYDRLNDLLLGELFGG